MLPVIIMPVPPAASRLISVPAFRGPMPLASLIISMPSAAVFIPGSIRIFISVVIPIWGWQVRISIPLLVLPL